ncbi:hypothetical protein CI610_01361 [invertebrate metagenome]|uniref:HTH cro/C1-type domain-containing protein n=1 Tax=invertebrate metagenome TaxID=1711999 RepID=A0A2H9T8X2_9ZZZZ
MDNPGKRIRKLRKEAGLSLRDLAELCDPPIDFTTVGRIERDMGYTSDSLKRICSVLKCEVSDLFLPEWLTFYEKLSESDKKTLERFAKAMYSEKKC